MDISKLFQVVQSAFVIECHVYPDGSWRADVVACRTPKGIEMHDGDEIVEDNVVRFGLQDSGEKYYNLP